jgi:transposase
VEIGRFVDFVKNQGGVVMRSYSLDLRERVVAAVEAKEGTWKEIAARFRVSVAWITKIRRQQKDLGTLVPQTFRCGRKPILTDEQRKQLAEFVRRTPDVTLKQLREQLGVKCCLQVIWEALNKLGFTYKKIGPGGRARSPRRERAANSLA